MLFLVIAVIIGGFQVIIMKTPVGIFFTVVQDLTGPEWAFCVGLGAGSVLLSYVLRVLPIGNRQPEPPAKSGEARGRHSLLLLLPPLAAAPPAATHCCCCRRRRRRRRRC